MISKEKNFLAWIELIDHLDEAKEHLAEITVKMSTAENYGANEFEVDIAHVYAHLNRIWNSRNSSTCISEEDWEKISKYPEKLEPKG